MVRFSNAFLVAAVAFSTVGPAIAAPFVLPDGVEPLQLPANKKFHALRTENIANVSLIEERGFGTELSGGLAGVLSSFSTKELLHKLFGTAPPRKREIEERGFGTDLSGSLAGVLSNFSAEELFHKLFHTAPPRRRELEDRGFGTELSGGLAGVLSSFSTKEILHKLFHTASPRRREIEDRGFGTDISGGLAGVLSSFSTKELFHKLFGTAPPRRRENNVQAKKEDTLSDADVARFVNALAAEYQKVRRAREERLENM